MIENGKYIHIHLPRKKSETEWMKDSVKVKDQAKVECGVEIVATETKMRVAGTTRGKQTKNVYKSSIMFVLYPAFVSFF